MGILKVKEFETAASPQKTETFSKGKAAKPIIVTARPGLTGPENALMMRLPQGYKDKTIADVLTYIMSQSKYNEQDSDTAVSLKNELGAAGTVLAVNGREAKLTEEITKYLVDKTRDIGGRQVEYQELEIEVSAVQQGGYRF